MPFLFCFGLSMLPLVSIFGFVSAFGHPAFWGFLSVYVLGLDSLFVWLRDINLDSLAGEHMEMTSRRWLMKHTMQITYIFSSAVAICSSYCVFCK